MINNESIISPYFDGFQFWTTNFYKIIIYIGLLYPYFIKYLKYYIIEKNIKKNIKYGNNERNYLDIYYPKNKIKGIAIFISGGAWIIGNKLWAIFLGKYFYTRGILLFAPDYRNYPDVNINTMVEDTICSIDFIIKYLNKNNICSKNIVLIGQSAGANIIFNTMLETKNRWGIKKFIGLSGAYLINNEFKENLKNKHIDSALIDKIMPNLNYYLDLFQNGSAYMPKIYILHGSRDKLISMKYIFNFVDKLCEINYNHHLKIYINGTHTNLFMEAPFSKNYMCLKDIKSIILDIEMDELYKSDITIKSGAIKIANDISPF